MATLTVREFAALFVLAHGDFCQTTASQATGWSAYGHVGDNTHTTELIAADYRKLTDAGLVRTGESGLRPGNIGVYVTETGRALLARNNARRCATLALLNDGGYAMHRTLRGLPR